MADRLPPWWGVAPPLVCGRLLRPGDPSSHCPSEATWHVIWTPELDNGLVCDIHKMEAVEVWTPYAVHPYEMVCSMPGAVFVHDLNKCVIDEGHLGISTEELMLASTGA